MPDQTTAVDTSNFRKHTADNPIQRHLIDRFHHLVLGRIGGMSPSSFLDAGCGEGFVTDLVVRQFPGLPVTAFDHNPESVAVARDRVPGIIFDVADINALPYADGQFDVTGCFEVLEHLGDPAAALSELARVTRRALVLSVPHEPWFSSMNAARGKNLDIRPRGSDPDHRNLWTRRAFATLASSALMRFTSAGGVPAGAAMPIHCT